MPNESKADKAAADKAATDKAAADKAAAEQRAAAAKRPDVTEGTIGKAQEPAAPSGAQSEPTPGLAPAGQGDQVILTGDAQAAARGGLHGSIEENTAARDKAIADGHVAPGTTAAAAAEARGEDPDAAPRGDYEPDDEYEARRARAAARGGAPLPPPDKA